MNIAQTIAAQIGNSAFAMMGAKNLIAGERSLQWKIGRNAKRINHITITLDPSDTYTVTFRTLSRLGEDRRPPVEFSGVYVDSLHRLIEGETGMYLSL